MIDMEEIVRMSGLKSLEEEKDKIVVGQLAEDEYSEREKNLAKAADLRRRLEAIKLDGEEAMIAGKKWWAKVKDRLNLHAYEHLQSLEDSRDVCAFVDKKPAPAAAESKS